MTAAALTLMAVRPTTSDVPGGRAPNRPFDDTRFEAFYRATASRLWSYIARMTGDSTAADDLLQKTYFHFIRTNPTVENEDHMRRYLFRAATNIALDHLRERKRERGRPAGTPPPSVEGHDDLRRDMMRVFSELKPRERALVWLVHVEEASHDEIAVALGVGSNSVRVLLFRARRKLATLLTKHGLAPEVLS